MRRAVALEPANAHYHSQLAMAVSKQGRFTEELASLRRGAALNQRSASLRNNMVIAMLDLHRQGHSAPYVDALPTASAPSSSYLEHAAAVAAGAAEAGLNCPLTAPFGRHLGEIEELLGAEGNLQVAAEVGRAIRRLTASGLVGGGSAPG